MSVYSRLINKAVMSGNEPWRTTWYLHKRVQVEQQWEFHFREAKDDPTEGIVYPPALRLLHRHLWSFENKLVPIFGIYSIEFFGLVVVEETVP